MFRVREHLNFQVTTLHSVGDKASIRLLLRRRNLGFEPLRVRGTERRKGQHSKASDKVQKMVGLVSVYVTAAARGMPRKKIPSARTWPVHNNNNKIDTEIYFGDFSLCKLEMRGEGTSDLFPAPQRVRCF